MQGETKRVWTAGPTRPSASAPSSQPVMLQQRLAAAAPGGVDGAALLARLPARLTRVAISKPTSCRAATQSWAAAPPLHWWWRVVTASSCVEPPPASWAWAGPSSPSCASFPGSPSSPRRSPSSPSCGALCVRPLGRGALGGAPHLSPRHAPIGLRCLRRLPLVGWPRLAPVAMATLGQKTASSGRACSNADAAPKKRQRQCSPFANGRGAPAGRPFSFPFSFSFFLSFPFALTGRPLRLWRAKVPGAATS